MTLVFHRPASEAGRRNTGTEISDRKSGEKQGKASALTSKRDW